MSIMEDFVMNAFRTLMKDAVELCGLRKRVCLILEEIIVLFFGVFFILLFCLLFLILLGDHYSRRYSLFSFVELPR